MSKKIITLGATALTALTLAGAVPTAAFADTSNQTQATQIEGVNIPDANLRKILTKILDKAEGAPLYKEDLQRLGSLNLNNKGITSLEGLQYCTNLRDLKVGNTEKGPLNTFTDLTPLKDLKQLKTGDFRLINVSDLSPLGSNLMNDLTISAFYVQATPSVTAVANADGTISLKNPCVGLNGEVVVPEDLKGATYDQVTNTFTWSKESFEKNAEVTTIHKGEVVLEMHSRKEGAEHIGEGVSAIMDMYVSLPSEETAQESVEQSIAIGGQGIGEDASHASGFARVTLDVKDHKASLIKGSDYCFHWSGWNSSKYASIKLTDPNGKVMYDQSWKGNESVKGNGYQKFGTFAQYDLPEGSTVEIYHAEGPWHRFHTSNDAELKNKLGKAGYTYTYKMQNNQLVLQSIK